MARPSAPTEPQRSGGLPKLSTSRDEAEQEKRIAASPPFWLVHDPGVFRVVEGRVLPGLRQFKLESGRNGVIQMSEDGPLIVDGALDNLRGKGSIPIPWDVDEEPYIVEAYPGVWTTRWMTVTPGSAHIKTDTIGYAAWVESLVRRGVLPRPGLADLDRLAGGLRFDIEKSSENPAVQPYRVRQLEAQLAVVERELELAEAAERAEAEARAERATAKRERQTERARSRSRLPNVSTAADADGEAGPDGEEGA